MKIVGYGICGPGEAKRYMRATLEEFKRLCDETIILCNNVGEAEKTLIKEYGFKFVDDNREWGVDQWKIKQDFVTNHVAALKPDFCVCLDMDEVFTKHLSRGWIESAPLDAYHVFIVDLWNDDDHYKPESCFWNVRLFRWNGETKFKEKPVHCGLAPEWTYYYHRFAPFILKHYGLMRPEDREKKIERYLKYDPNSKHMERKYYKMLADPTAKPFKESEISATIAKEVETYQQTKPRNKQPQMKPRYAYVKNPHGVVVDIPEKSLADTMRQPGFEFVGWAEDTQKEMEKLFEGVETKPSTETIMAQEEAHADTVPGNVHQTRAGQLKGKRAFHAKE